MTYKSEATRLLASQTKAHFGRIFNASEYTQESLARECGVVQQDVSNWQNDQSERQLPAFILGKLPQEMALELASEILRPNGIEVRLIGKRDTVNGSVFDEMKHMMITLGGIAKRAELLPENIPALRKLSREMEKALEQFNAELDAKENGK